MPKKIFKLFKSSYLALLNVIGEVFVASGIFRIYMTRNRSSFVMAYHHPDVRTIGAHIAFFKKYFTVIDFDSILQRMERKETLNNVCITFDDGYRYIFKSLFPVFLREKVSFAVFISTKNIENDEPFWWDIYDFKKKAYGMKSEVDLKSMRSDIREDILNVNDAERSSDYLSERSALSWSDLRTMLHSGLLKIGDHGYSHTSITLMNEDERRNDLVRSRNLIKERLGIEVRDFAYPNGDFTLDMEKTLKGLGYRSALTTLPKENAVSTNPFFLRRIEADTSGLGILALKLMGIYYPLTGYRLERYLMRRGAPVKEMKGGKI